METFTLNIDVIQWIILGIGTAIWFFITKKATSKPGYLSGIDGIIPTFFYLLFVIAWLVLFFVILQIMTTDEAKEYCINVIGMSEDDFVKANSDDIELDEVSEGDWLHHFMTPTECGDEGDMKTAVELATEHEYWSNPENVDNYIDFMMTDE